MLIHHLLLIVNSSLTKSINTIYSRANSCPFTTEEIGVANVDTLELVSQENGLIKSSTPVEQVLFQIKFSQKENITSRYNDREAERLQKKICELFLELVEHIYKLDKEQLLQFNDVQIESLAEYVYLRTKNRAFIGGIFLWTLGILGPVIDGMIFSDVNWDIDWSCSSYSYRRRCKQLANMTGAKYFSAKWLRSLEERGDK